MGPLELRDLEETPEVGDGINQLVYVKRCRFLEQSGCASVCVNACKFPTQDLFNGDMGVPICVEINQCVGCTDSSLSHFSAMTRLCRLRRAARNRHPHAMEQAPRRWRGGRRND